MSSKLAIGRLKTLAAHLAKAEVVLERVMDKDPDRLDPSIVSRFEDLVMEVGMALADAEEEEADFRRADRSRTA